MSTMYALQSITPERSTIIGVSKNKECLILEAIENSKEYNLDEIRNPQEIIAKDLRDRDIVLLSNKRMSQLIYHIGEVPYIENNNKQL